MNFSVEIVTFPCSFNSQLHELIERNSSMIDSKKKDYSQMSLDFITSLFMEQDCLPHSVLLQLFNECTLVHCDVGGSHGGLLGGQQLKFKYFPQINSK